MSNPEKKPCDLCGPYEKCTCIDCGAVHVHVPAEEFIETPIRPFSELYSKLVVAKSIARARRREIRRLHLAGQVQVLEAVKRELRNTYELKRLRTTVLEQERKVQEVEAQRDLARKNLDHQIRRWANQERARAELLAAHGREARLRIERDQLLKSAEDLQARNAALCVERDSWERAYERRGLQLAGEVDALRDENQALQRRVDELTKGHLVLNQALGDSADREEKLRQQLARGAGQ